MSSRTSIYKFLYSQFGDIWYPGYDYENMLSVESQFQGVYSFFAPSIISGWQVEKLTDNRTDQLLLLDGYVESTTSEYGYKLDLLDLGFSVTAKTATTANITLTGAQTIDGISVVAGNIVLVKNQSTASQNGVYTVGSGAWSRHSSLNSSSDYTSNYVVYVESGDDNEQTLWLGAVSATNFTLGSTNLYFDNAFKQCVKVSSGRGILDKYAAITEKSYYFRYAVNNTFYVWAEPGISTLQDEFCEIVSPQNPDENYDSYSSALYLAEIVVEADTTYADYNIVSEIKYSTKRKQFNETLGDFQTNLNLSYLKHKHLGDKNSASKIDLRNYLVLNASNYDESNTYSNTNVFLLRRTSGEIFADDIAGYGEAIVKLDGQTLAAQDYNIYKSGTSYKLFLTYSIKQTSTLKVYLPIAKSLKLYAVDSSQQLLTSALVLQSYKKLSNGIVTQQTNDDGSITDIYELFSWSNFDYRDAIVKINNATIDPIHYRINPTSGTIYLNKSFPNYDDYTFEDLSITISENVEEITNSLPNERISNISANSILSGKVSIKNLILNHYSDNLHKVSLTFTPNKFLVTGIGKSYFYPHNTNSKIQYYDDITVFLESQNIISNIPQFFAASSRGLFSFNINSNLASDFTSWKNDYGKIVSLQDNILPDENYFNNLYAVTSNNRVFYKDVTDKWTEIKYPKNSTFQSYSIDKFIVSSDKLVDDSYQTYYYSTTSDKIFYAVIPENEAVQNWDWIEISNYYDSSGTAITTLNGISNIKEINPKRITFVENKPDEITYDHFIYVANNDNTDKGIYVGDQSQISQIYSEKVNGIYIIQNNDYKNNILWWNDYDLYLTHAARYVEDATGKYWILPFNDSSASYTSAAVATTTNISLSGLQTIDGYTLSTSDRVLVKDQTDKTANGIYLAAAGGWSRASDLDASSEFVSYKKITVTNGTVFGSSVWFLKPNDSFNLGTSNLEWDVYKLKVYSTDTPSGASARSIISCATERKSFRFFNEYFIGHSNGVARIKDFSADNTTISASELYWEPLFQGSVNTLFSYDDGTNSGKLYVGTTNGIFISSDLLWEDDTNNYSFILSGYKWKRPNDTFGAIEPNFVVYNSDYQAINDASLIYNYQLVSTGTSYVSGEQLYYENNFTTFNTEPWSVHSNTQTRNMVYINNKPSSIPFFTNSLDGTVTFLQSVSKDDLENITLSVVSENPVITNSGTKPHSSTFVPISRTSLPIAKLWKDNINSDTTLLLNQRISSYDLLLLKNETTSELVIVKSIDNTVFPIEVVLTSARSSSGISFLKNTEVYGVADDVVSGLEDDIYVLKSQQKYYLDSSNNQNIQELARSLKAGISTVFDFVAPVVSQTDTRGLKNTLLVSNFLSSSTLDPDNSSYKKRTELVPSIADPESDPVMIRSILGPEKTGENTKIATDLGVWKCVNNKWALDSILDNASDTAYIVQNPELDILVGATNGLWKYNTAWTKVDDKKQNCYLKGFWNGLLFEAFGKSDGLSIKVYENGTFTSDFLKLTNSNINGFFKGQYIKIGSGTTEIYESLHAAGDDGYYVLGYQANNSSFGQFINPRKMFATGNPDGVTRFYNSFQAYSVPTSSVNSLYANPLFILTNDGLIKVKNWKYSYPDNLGSSDYVVDQRYLRNIECLCYAIDTDAAIGTTPGKSKIFIGTNKGVYRSLDEGNSFHNTEFMGTNPSSVFDLKIFSSSFNSLTQNVLLAATNNGLWYTLDDGDNWYRTGENTSEGYSPVLFESKPASQIKFVANDSNTVGYLAQTFTTASTANTITKVSAYVTVRDQDSISNASYNDSVTNSSLIAYVYSLDSNSKPQTQLASSTSISSSSVRRDGFTTFDLTSDLDIPGSGVTTLAIVIKETSSSVPLFNWRKSTQVNPVSGAAFTSVNGSTWYEQLNQDFFYKVHYDVNSSPTDTIVSVGNYDNSEVNWETGVFKGVLANDSGHLVLDSKFLVSNVFDSSNSVNRAYNSKSKFNSYLTSLFTRTAGRTYQDLWTLGTEVKHRSSAGFTNSGTAITNIISGLAFEGDSSNLYESLEHALIGQQPSAISGIANTTEITSVRDYLYNNNLLRIADLKTRYKNESQKQLNVIPATGSIGTTITISSDGTNTFTWSISEYPYIEIVKNSSILSSGFTTSPSTGQITFSTPILSTDEIEIYFRKDWDGTYSSIPSNTTVSEYMMERWGKSFIPLVNIVSDFDSDETINQTKLIERINYSWNNQGTKVLSFDVDENANTGFIRKVNQETQGLVFDASSDTYWTNLSNDLIHGGSNNLFSGTWSKNLEFSDPKYIKSITTSYVASTGQSVDSACLVEYRYSKDRKNFSSWASFASTTSINKEITNIDFKITLTEGWNNATQAKVTPYVQTLYYTEVTPSVDYLFSDVLTTAEDISEYILSTKYSDTSLVKLAWGICKGDSTNWEDFEEILSGKNGVFASRQKSYKFTQQVTKEKLICLKSPNNSRTFFVYENGAKYTWNLSDVISVFINDTLVDTTLYTSNNVNGTITFTSDIVDVNNVRATIVTGNERYEALGEGTISTDYVSYYAVNGRWPVDSKIVVLVNNEIVRGGYKLDRVNGRIIFNVRRSSSDIVTLFIAGNTSYRIGLKLEKFNSNASETINFEFTNNTVPNKDVYSRYVNTPIPSLKSESLQIDSRAFKVSAGSTSEVSLSERLFTSYEYISDNEEYRPKTKWYRVRTSGGGTTVSELDSSPNYRNKLLQSKSDLNSANNYFIENDQVYVVVEPYDNFDYGISYTSSPVILKSQTAPYASDVKIKSIVEIVNNKIQSNNDLQAYYYYSATNDLSRVEWFEWTNGVSFKIAEGSVLNSSLVLKNKAISFTVTPYDGQFYGLPQDSQIVHII